MNAKDRRILCEILASLLSIVQSLMSATIGDSKEYEDLYEEWEKILDGTYNMQGVRDKIRELAEP